MSYQIIREKIQQLHEIMQSFQHLIYYRKKHEYMGLPGAMFTSINNWLAKLFWISQR